MTLTFYLARSTGSSSKVEHVTTDESFKSLRNDYVKIELKCDEEMKEHNMHSEQVASESNASFSQTSKLVVVLSVSLLNNAFYICFRIGMARAKHVMLSYQWDSQALVTDVYRCLRAHNIPLWMDTQGGMKGHLSTSMAEGVENAAVVCCFLTPKYQDSVACKDELTYAKEQGVRIIPIRLVKEWKPTGWLGFSITGLKYINFSDAATNMELRINQLIDEIQMLAGDKLSTVETFHWKEDNEKQPEASASSSNENTDEATTHHFDPDCSYRFTTQWLGDGMSLDISNDGKNNNQIALAKSGNRSGQHWKFTFIGDGYYRLTTRWQGDELSLTFVKDAKSNGQLLLTPNAADSAQYWKITLLKNGYSRITCKWQGYDKSLDVVNDDIPDKVQLAKTGHYSGQYWRIMQV